MTDVVPKADTVKLTIDGIEVEAPKGALVIRAAEQIGISIPRFCDHPLLAPAGACRQCLVDIEGQRKPVASCTQPVAEGMVVRTQMTSEVAKKAQEGIMEFLLINHPLDCPVCDKGGECPLQNQAMSNGQSESRFVEHKREYPKPLPISTQVLLDRERCVLCQRCTRFSDEIAGDKFIDLMERSSNEQIGVFRGNPETPEDDAPFNSYFSGNTIQICPVGALTSAQYRFRARPFDLVSTPSACEHCAAGCDQRADHRRGKVMRRLAGDDPAVNEEWNCDKGRFAFQYTNATDRLTKPLVRDSKTGELREASWPEALTVAAAGLAAAKDNGGVGVLTGGRLTVEDAFAYSKFARVALGTNDIDFRARPLSAEETEFLGSSVAGKVEVTYADIERAGAVVFVGLEPEEECPIIFLRARKTYLKRGLPSFAVAPFVSRGFEKLGATVLLTAPGAEAEVLGASEQLREALSAEGAILFVGERLAGVEGGLSAAARIAEETGARLAWVPRRAGDRGAVEAGALPTLLPGGRPVYDPAARSEVAAAWQLDAGVLPSASGRDTDAIIAAAKAGQLGALLVGGVDPADLSDPIAAEQALDEVGFVVSLELRLSAVAKRADVVLPIAPAVEKTGSYVNWEGRVRPFGTVLKTAAMSDARVLDALGRELGIELGVGDVDAVRAQLATLAELPLPGTAETGTALRASVRATVPTVAPGTAAAPAGGQAVLASWHHLLDNGSLQDGDGHLAGTARTPVVRISKSTAADLGVADGDAVTVGTERGAITLPALVADMVDGVVWVPTNSPGSTLRRTLGVAEGALVEISSGGTKS
ncbi:NADH-quinone oxidoreductase subunit G [Dactylosporangium aurantiacum]|uniref:NADH-quinone oxidoreductase n=1 Tax=Dactylosporangium aurantiacum TaxID=35754 RepID=A0A9Q9IFR6_9ACTN|nr:NADH-quinone oxidoreductase subunit G [Dactylosporangium aurantiacum]MDG6101059.1 NADH-quinone oxidoreductase subunit G [Dactylosporangium aurantiacum]UWZ54901.1 NADH-quinone oxidoreductase subunit G [Dactylosporangium aurantiacum]